jgi:hypothetical protein
VQWRDDAIEEVDLELDVRRFADGSVRVRDQDDGAALRTTWDLPDEIVRQAEDTGEHVRRLVEAGAAPFGCVGFGDLGRRGRYRFPMLASCARKAWLFRLSAGLISCPLPRSPDSVGRYTV